MHNDIKDIEVIERAMKNVLSTAAMLGTAALVAACTPTAQPICDREAIAYDKWGEVAALPPECLPAPQGSLSLPTLDRPTHDRDRDRPAPEPEPEQHEKPKGNNGLGNGDQPAPGGSGPNNNAENAEGNPGHPSGKPQNAN